MARGRPRTRVMVAVIAASVVVLVGAGLALWRLTRPAPTTPTAQTVTVAAARTILRQSITASGTLASQRQSYLNFPAAGTVATVQVKIGDAVAAGQVLATQDSTMLDAAVSSAEAGVEAARANLTTVRNSSSATDTQITTARAQLASAQAKLTTARNDRAGATMTAPFAGVVAQVNLTQGIKVAGSVSTTTGAGTTATASSSLQAGAQIVVVDVTAWQVNANVGTADLGSLKQGMASLVTPTGSNAHLPGTLTSIGIVGSSSSGQASFPIIVTITGNPPNLYIGGTADVAITISESEALAVPTGAVHTENGQSMVRMVKDGTEKPVPVKLGRTLGQQTEILEGIREGDRVVIPAEAASPSPSGPAASSPASPAPSSARSSR